MASSGVIEIRMKAAPNWGKTAHDARLTCGHGSTEYTVFGDDARRAQMARDMAPAHRSRCGCDCAVGEGEPAST